MANGQYSLAQITGAGINVIKLAPLPSREGNKMLKESLKKRRHLEREHGDGAFYFPHGVRHR